jgi:quinol monooxygenase YgiN
LPGPSAAGAARYGRHGLIRATPGQREALLAILAEVARSSRTMPGCRLYLVGAAHRDAEAIAVTEVWDDQAAHAASLTLETVRSAIARARPLIAGMDAASEFDVVAGLEDER